MGPVPKPLQLIALTALYFAAGKLGLALATVNSSASAVWPPTGIALGALILFGSRLWPAVFVGAFLVNVTAAGNVATSLGIAAGNTLEGLAGAYLVNQYANGRQCFERARDVFKFAALAAASATMISATIGAIALCVGGLAAWRDAGAIWLTWWLGDATGALIVTPVLMLWHARPLPVIPPEHRVEALPTLLIVMAVTTACFTAPVLRDYPLVFLCLPPLAWIAFRFGPREAATAILLLAIVAVAATESGVGPFVMRTRGESLLVLQAFTGMVAITLLPMAALVRERRLAIAEAHAATHARDIFLAMLSHELRNPLQAIVTSLHILETSASRAETDRAIAIAHRQSDHLARLLNDLLDVARAVSGKVRLDPRPMRLDEAARHAADLLQGSVRLGMRMLTVEAKPVVVDADAARVDQILNNLLSNALKFTSPNGTIFVTVREEGGRAVLRVRDDGVGIAQDLLPQVFDLFTQGERRLDRSDGGLGIGLTLVRRLAELQGGSVEAHSAGPGEGSEFVVRFPLADAAVEKAQAGGAAMRAPGLFRVLIVEDNADARESLKLALGAEGHDVFEAADGEEAVEIAQRVRPDVVIVDIGLPRIDGYEVARRLRAKQATLGVRWRLIALTGYGQPEDIRRAEDAGFNAHLMKPVHPDSLQKAMSGDRPLARGKTTTVD